MKKNQRAAFVSGIKMMLACALAYLVSIYLYQSFSFWIVVTVAAVFRPELTNMFGKIITRIFGTLLGGVFAYFILLIARDNYVVLIALFFIVIFLSSYIALQKTIISYGGVVVGLTLPIVISASFDTQTIEQAVKYRVVEMLAGIVCVTIATYVLRLILREKEKVTQPLFSQFKEAWYELMNVKRVASLTVAALTTAVVTSVVYYTWLRWQYPEGFWAAISCLFIMEESVSSANNKSWLRFLSHLVASLIGVVSILIFYRHEQWLFLPLFLGFFGFGYLMVKSKFLSHSGNTMAIALAVMLLARVSSEAAHLDMVIVRFLNVIGGIAIGLLTMHFVEKVMTIRSRLAKRSNFSEQ